MLRDLRSLRKRLGKYLETCAACANVPVFAARPSGSTRKPLRETQRTRAGGGIGNYGRNVNQTAQRGVQGAYTGGKVTMAGTGAALGNAGGRIKGLLIK